MPIPGSTVLQMANFVVWSGLSAAALRKSGGSPYKGSPRHSVMWECRWLE
jgi:hypothetical protein